MKQLRPIEQETNLDFYKNLFKRLIKNWYLFVISFVICISIGHYIVKSSNVKYGNESILLIQDQTERNRSRSDLSELEMFNLASTTEDELGIISSFPVVYETIKQLKLEVSYYIKNGLINLEIYKNSPIEVRFDSTISQPVGVLFKLDNITKDGYTLIADSKEEVPLFNYENETVSGLGPKITISETHNFGDEVVIGKSKFKIIINNNFNLDNIKDNSLFFKFNDLKWITYEYKAGLLVERKSITSALVSVSCRANNPDLTTDFLNTLSQVYLNRNLKKKNDIANKTINFIDGQISGIADSLGLTAEQLKDFRTKNDVMDINFLAQNVYEQMRELENKRAELLVASKYYDYIKEYFENNKDLTDLNAPSAMGVNDPQLQSLITQLTAANAKRQLHIDNKSINNPQLPILNAEINNLKKTILENIEYIVNTSNITLNDISNRIAKLNAQVKNLPSIEKELKNIEREFHVNDAIYTFLLSTRAEAEIARASNSPDYEVVDPAKYNSAVQVAPKKNIIYLGSFFLGLMIPIGLIMLISFFRNSIEDKREIEKISHFPVIGTIARNEKHSLLPLYDHPKSLISESFRSVRTGMQFFQKGKNKQKILVTSSMSGDGKSFIAINIAAAYSHSGKKTLLLEYDMRNPKIADYLGLQNGKGLSSYLINDARLEDIIQKTNMKYFDIISAGETPPNPVELIASENTKNLLEIVQNIYDYIIIDTPPVGVVTDSYLLMDYSDANIFVVRLNYTSKNFFTSIIKDMEQKEIPNIGILINEDTEKTMSVYYSDSVGKMPYLKSKFNTFKSLIGIKNKN